MSFDLVPSICKHIGIYTNNNDLIEINNLDDINHHKNCDILEEDSDYYIDHSENELHNSVSDDNYTICNQNQTKQQTKQQTKRVNGFEQPFILFAEHIRKKMTIPLLVLVGINSQYETAQMTMVMEKKCPYGLYCPHKTNPLKCPYNHHDIPDIIEQGKSIPSLVCRYERLWKKHPNSNKPLICMNPNCWYNHCEGRVQRLQQSNYYKQDSV